MKDGLGRTIDLPRMFGAEMHHRENFNMRCDETLPIRLSA
jgi:hypothetical protein